MVREYVQQFFCKAAICAADGVIIRKHGEKISLSVMMTKDVSDVRRVLKRAGNMYICFWEKNIVLT